jgi:hypothetical protein
MNVNINITTTPTALPAGVIAGLLAISITDTAGHPVNDANGQALATQQVSGNSGTFNSVAAGDYIASVVRLDTNGTPLGNAVTQAFSVPTSAPAAPTGTSTPASSYDAPQTITVTVA